MQEIIIDEEFRGLLPALDDDTFQLLEKNVIEHGCREPLVLWNGILIDGYNRYKICIEHDIPFKTIDMKFDSREEVLIWIITNQVSRRNLTPMQLRYFRGLHYGADKKVHGTNRYTDQGKSAQNEHSKGSTANRLSEQYRVSNYTIRRDEKLAEAITSIGESSAEARRKILSGEVSINMAKLEALASASDEEIAAVAAEIEEGTYMRRVPRTPISDSVLPEIRELNTAIKNFSSNFNVMFQQLNNGNTVELKPVLRSFIDRLEELYGNI